MRLSQAALAALPATVRQPGYDRTAQRRGIVHFGIGAFHRAHQAVYTDDAMAAGDRDWMITGVSLRSPDVRDQLAPQDGLYTVVERGAGASLSRIVGAVAGVIVAPEEPDAVVDALASPDTHVVSFTITEKGYWRGTDGALNFEAADVAHDARGEGAPRTIYGFLHRAMARRRAGNVAGLSLVSCDNLAENGVLLRTLLDQFLMRVDPDVAAWFRAHCTCPSTMVDRIVPATTAADRDALAAELGVRDEAAVVTEGFRQWVIEDDFAGPRPRWEVGGAQIVPDVVPYETAKLRMLNGAHSALAYLGLRSGHEFVHQAIGDPAIRATVERLMREEAAATLAPGFDAGGYADALIARFSNPSLQHRLAQIAMDGSQKVPQRWLQPLAINRAAGRPCPATMEALAAWLLHLRGDARPVDDPLAGELATLWRSAGMAGIARALFGGGGMFAPIWPASDADIERLGGEVARLDR